MSEVGKRQVGGEHYKTKIQVWDYIHKNGIGYLAGNVIKYASRYEKKNGLEDLLKARHYIDKLIEEEIVEAEAEADTQAQNEIAESMRREAQ